MESALSLATVHLHLNTNSYDDNSGVNSWSGTPDEFNTRPVNQTFPIHGRMHSILLGVSLGSLSLITTVMNMLVLYAVKREKSLHTVGNLYVVSLSVADLIVGTTVMPLNLVYLLEDEWKLGRAICQFWLIMDYVASTASIFSLFILCLDRYRSVRQPLKYLKYRTRGKASAMISGAWLLSMLWIFPILGWRSFTHVELKPEEEKQCDTDFRFVTWFKVITAVFNFYVPSVLMLWFYTHIYLAVRQHLRDRERIIHPTDSFGEKDIEQNAGSSNNSKSQEKECEAPDKLLRQQLDLKLLEQTYSLEEIDRTKKSLCRSHRKIGAQCPESGLLGMTAKEHKISTKPGRESLSNKEKSQDAAVPLSSHCSQPENSGGNQESSLNECCVTVPNTVRGVCDINQVQRYTPVLGNNHNPSGSLPWSNETDGAEIDPANEVTLRQTWQRFVEMSCERLQSLRIHKEHKAARQLGFIIAAFLLCWIPYFIVFMVMAFCRECVHHDLHMFTIWLGYINSTLNPFIYPMCNRNFKRVFKNILHIHF
ncbi:histamine H1 receptor [Corythoichthys intestinalis]|uniref:histamine H1 receptor n=1 Tax=Corythoichthys intestinalis TaxID=161448 RepID=UPI0025A62B4D|nr:histamine H1 receptor [Corythoichthys intestinalis]XP_057700843.1 histamine H1 receptor [Corythoichthys intestinalis]XP_057700844.1 histamine H1 receptor [Corythoichthys intestinalis]XP_057700845.1 histamine H1 receptor [Corythoichthys intestinalis]XP_061813631.1 histamine H1 receptor-like [Nerophis lumbriciformis]